MSSITSPFEDPVPQGPGHAEPNNFNALPAAEQLERAKGSVKVTFGSQPVEDNWVHRSTGMRCGTCMWWVQKGDGDRVFGRCRKHAPTLDGWPAVFATDWCGDHKLDEKEIL